MHGIWKPWLALCASDSLDSESSPSIIRVTRIAFAVVHTLHVRLVPFVNIDTDIDSREVPKIGHLPLIER